MIDDIQQRVASINVENVPYIFNNAKVDITSCAFSQDVGAAELKTFWTDPTFEVTQRAFYYVRALENPTCRWSTWDALRNNVEPRSDIPKTIQERVWSSPIHYIP